MDNLVFCPFCGQKDLSIIPDISEDEEKRIYAYHVYCNTCGCTGRNHYPIGWCETEEEAIEAWNHRGSIKPEYLHCSNNYESYSIEEYGPWGPYALYFGKNTHSKGTRLCNLYDFTNNGFILRKTIVNMLNSWLKAGNEGSNGENYEEDEKK